MFATHTILTLWIVTKDPLFEKLSATEQNVLKWAALLHDIAKRGTPTICGRDHVHAFRSAAATVQILEQLGIVQHNSTAQREQWE